LKPSKADIVATTVLISFLRFISTRSHSEWKPRPTTMVTKMATRKNNLNPDVITVDRSDRVRMINAALYDNRAFDLKASRYAVNYSDSYVVAITGKSGVFSFAGHDHAVMATKWSANININPSDLAHSNVAIELPTVALAIDSGEARRKAGLGPGPSVDEVRTIQQRMLSGEVLDAAQYPQIRFASETVEVNAGGHLRVIGDFELRGHRHRITLPVRYRSSGPRTEFDGEIKIRQTDYGLMPESVAGGTIKVKDEVEIRFHVEMDIAK
jgi:polyisoprenoid-binding protein YceI